jgi:hypothetical protein
MILSIVRSTLRDAAYAAFWTLPVVVAYLFENPTGVRVTAGLVVGWVLRGNWYARDVRIAEQRGWDRARAWYERKRSVFNRPRRLPEVGVPAHDLQHS